MSYLPQLLLIGAVAVVGVLHTIVPDHWVPITLIARQRRWSRTETRNAALKAGTGHVVSTLLIGIVVWIGGVAFATHFGNLINSLSSLALVAFGVWFMISAYQEMLRERSHSHVHDHEHHNDKKSNRTALLLILGSSPMIEGIPAFFAASKYGIGLLLIMAIVFAISTIATYVILCTYSTTRLQNTSFGVFENYGEVLSGAFIAFVGLFFWIWPIL
jgi:large-conductance mechanosensitive channel